MTWFPQIGTGSVAQFPVQRARNWRAISNDLESGERILLPDTAGGQIEWRLSYRDLTDAEAQNLASLFAASQGAFGAFTFIDPLANLLAWSENLSHPDWQAGLLQNTAGVNDPLGTQRAWAVSNATTGSQFLQQTIGISGDYVACFSAYVRSNSPGAVVLQRDALQATFEIGSAWTRLLVSGTGAAGAAQSTFSMVINAGQTIDVWGMQVEAQPHPSTYKVTAAALGIYEETYFETDELNVSSDGVGLSSCAVTLISRA